MADNSLYLVCQQLSVDLAAADRLVSSNLRSCVNHFSHNHPLRPIKVQAEEELICSACGLDLSGSAFKCSKSNCEFILHKSCFRLEPVLEHDSHPDHPLTLLSSPPKKYRNRRFICNACGDFGTTFDYHCSVCNFDLHVGCACLPKTVKHVDHHHPLTLLYFSSFNVGRQKRLMRFGCDVCGEVVPEENWVYNCFKCDYATHLLCATPE